VELLSAIVQSPCRELIGRWTILLMGCQVPREAKGEVKLSEMLVATPKNAKSVTSRSASRSTKEEGTANSPVPNEHD